MPPISIPAPVMGASFLNGAELEEDYTFQFLPP